MTVESFISGFVAKLRHRANELRLFGAAEPSQACEAVAEELERQFSTWWREELSVSEASEESGYSAERLRELVRSDVLPANRRGGEIRIRRADLPKRPAGRAQGTPVDKLAAAILESRK